MANQNRIESLHSGGLITNYICPSRCRHCLYFSCPEQPREYINVTLAAQGLDRIYSLGCRTMHIGGGEPFMNFSTLLEIVKIFRRTGIALEYIETNSSWYKNQQDARLKLQQLKDEGTRALLLSISPFHNEFTPLNKVESVAEAAYHTGLPIIPWKQDFISDLKRFSLSETHPLEEQEALLGSGYLKNCIETYPVILRGRALHTLNHLYPRFSTEEIMSSHPGGCGELLQSEHFHIDLYDSFIPGLCSGLRLQTRDLGMTAPAEKYPLLTRLIDEGISGLYRLAVDQYDFTDTDSWISKCHLCQEIRIHLFQTSTPFIELGPPGFYETALSEKTDIIDSKDKTEADQEKDQSPASAKESKRTRKAMKKKSK